MSCEDRRDCNGYSTVTRVTLNLRPSVTCDNYIAACTSKETAPQRLLSLALIDMAKDDSQSSKQSKSSRRFNIFKQPISPAPSEQSQGNSSKSWSLLPKLSSKSPSTTPTPSTSSLPLLSSTVDSRGDTGSGEHAIISPSYVLLNSM